MWREFDSRIDTLVFLSPLRGAGWGEEWKSEEWKVAAILAVVLQSVALSALWFYLLSLAGDAGV